MGPIGCPETSVTTILRSVKSQKSADLKVIFKFVAAKILLQCWKQLTITGGQIP
jgi:hypothetical protein